MKQFLNINPYRATFKKLNWQDGGETQLQVGKNTYICIVWSKIYINLANVMLVFTFFHILFLKDK